MVHACCPGQCSRRQLLQEGNVEDREMFSTFNMGVGMVLVAAAAQVEALRAACPELRQIGSMVQGQGVQISGIDL